VTAVAAFLRRDWRVARTYRTALAGHAVGLVAFLLTFALFTPVVRDDFAARYGATYLGFAAVGIAVSGALLAALSAFAGAFAEAQVEGTLEAMLLAPVPHERVVAALGAWPLTLATAGCGLTLAFAELGGAGFRVSLPSLVLTAALSLAVFVAFGLLSAAVMVLTKRGDPVALVFGLVGALSAGAYVPTSTFPGWLAPIAALNPMTYALDAWRGALLRAASPLDLARPLGILALAAAAGLPLAWAALRRSLAVARTEGSLSTY
jgi:ABC-2 type transport system permease protein